MAPPDLPATTMGLIVVGVVLFFIFMPTIHASGSSSSMLPVSTFLLSLGAFGVLIMSGSSGLGGMILVVAAVLMWIGAYIAGVIGQVINIAAKQQKQDTDRLVDTQNRVLAELKSLNKSISERS
jgi:hypothetical protein